MRRVRNRIIGVPRRLFLMATGGSDFVAGLVLAIAAGLLAAAAAVVFRWMLILSQDFFAQQAVEASIVQRFLVALIPAGGGLAAGVLWWKLSPEVRGPGVASVVEAVAVRRGRIPLRVAPVKMAATALTLGSGGSAGAEGPIVQIGASLGSAIARAFLLPEAWVRLLVACGAAGAVSALFNTPIAGVFFALEVILRRFTPQNFSLVVVSSVLADVASHAVFGDRVVFDVPEFGLVSAWEVLIYVTLGIIAGLMSVGFIRALFFVDSRSARLPGPPFLQPALGGLLVGVIGLWVPGILGVGYPQIEGALHGRVAFEALVLLVVFKLLATSLTVGTGGSGGVFAPALFIGATLGGAFGVWAHHLAPDITGTSGAYALAGMAALLAGTMRAPITAVLMVFEMSRSYGAVLPLLITVVVSTGVSAFLSKGTIFTQRLIKRGIDLDRFVRQSDQPNRRLRVRDAIRGSEGLPRPGMSLEKAVIEFERHGLAKLPVVDEEERPVGMLYVADVIRATSLKLEVSSVMKPINLTVSPEQSIARLTQRVRGRDLDGSPVVDRSTGRVVGVLSLEGIIGAQPFNDGSTRTGLGN